MSTVDDHRDDAARLAGHAAGHAAGQPTAPVDPRPIELGDAGRGVLLLHGLTGTPHEVRPIARALFEAGYAVRAPLLSGHTDLEALESSTWRDWYDSAREALEALRDGGRRPVVVLGFSMGALLCLRLAALRGPELTGAVAVSVPLHLPGWKQTAIHALARLRTTPVLRNVIGVLTKSGGPDVRVQREVDDSPSLSGFPYPTLAELVALQGEVTDLLPHVRAPLLVLHGALDHIASPADSERVAQCVGSERVELRILPRSFHVVGLDLDRQRVCDEITRFAASVLGRPGDPLPKSPAKRRM